jgi:hypothetical protein
MGNKSRGVGRCEVCGAVYEDSGHGSRRKYCSAHCRRLAWMSRKISGEFAEWMKEKAQSKGSAA